MDRYDDFNILSRSMTEISADVNEVLTQLEGYVGRVEGDIDEFTKLAHHLQDEITAARMVPIGTLYSLLSRRVRDAAKSRRTGGSGFFREAKPNWTTTLFSRFRIRWCTWCATLWRMESSFRKLAWRTEKRKKEKFRCALTIAAITLYRSGRRWRGIDYERVKQSAIECGLVSHETADRLTERDLREMLFHPGFSTAVVKTVTSGPRCCGLDVVRSNLNALNGEI